MYMDVYYGPLSENVEQCLLCKCVILHNPTCQCGHDNDGYNGDGDGDGDDNDGKGNDEDGMHICQFPDDDNGDDDVDDDNDDDHNDNDDNYKGDAYMSVL